VNYYYYYYTKREREWHVKIVMIDLKSQDFVLVGEYCNTDVRCYNTLRLTRNLLHYIVPDLNTYFCWVQIFPARCATLVVKLPIAASQASVRWMIVDCLCVVLVVCTILHCACCFCTTLEHFRRLKCLSTDYYHNY